MKVLFAQHRAGRVVTERILAIARGRVRDDTARRDLAVGLASFICMHEPHAAREDTDLFPTFHNLMGDRAYRDLDPAAGAPGLADVRSHLHHVLNCLEGRTGQTTRQRRAIPVEVEGQERSTNSRPAREMARAHKRHAGRGSEQVDKSGRRPRVGGPEPARARPGARDLADQPAIVNVEPAATTTSMRDVRCQAVAFRPAWVSCRSAPASPARSGTQTRSR